MFAANEARGQGEGRNAGAIEGDTERRRTRRCLSQMELPERIDPQDIRWRSSVEWVQQRLFAVLRLWDAEIRAVNPHARFIPSAGGALSYLDMKTVGELADTLFADRQGRSSLTPPWASGKGAKEYRATLGHKPTVGILGVGLESDYRA